MGSRAPPGTPYPTQPDPTLPPPLPCPRRAGGRALPFSAPQTLQPPGGREMPGLGSLLHEGGSQGVWLVKQNLSWSPWKK